MIREDRELLTELARLNRELAPLAMRMMEGSASTTEQQTHAERLIAIGERLKRRVEGTKETVIEGEVLTSGALALPVYTVEPHWEL
ncbi:MAG: hypothetical protein ACRDRR_17830 [Pseudonocardiaceae bacterium]